MRRVEVDRGPVYTPPAAELLDALADLDTGVVSKVIGRSFQEAVNSYDQTGNPDAVFGALRRTLNWKNQQALGKLGIDALALTERVHAHIDAQPPTPLPAVPDGVGAVVTDGGVRDQLNAMARFACLDANTYAEKLSPHGHNRYIVSERLALADDHRNALYGVQVRAGLANAERADRTYQPRDLARVADAVDQAEGGICTTFALAGAHRLLELQRRQIEQTGDSPIKRVEVLAGADHSYVVINRPQTDDRPAKDGPTRVQPAGQSAWEGAIICDPWAGSLGHPVFYADVRDSPASLQKYVQQNITLAFDSFAQA